MALFNKTIRRMMTRLHHVIYFRHLNWPYQLMLADRDSLHLQFFAIVKTKKKKDHTHTQFNNICPLFARLPSCSTYKGAKSSVSPPACQVQNTGVLRYWTLHSHGSHNATVVCWVALWKGIIVYPLNMWCCKRQQVHWLNYENTE